MDTLRSPHGCPWDRAQTHASLRPHLIEEAYEAIAAIEAVADVDGSAGPAGSPTSRDAMDADAELASELGDVLFQCVFHAQIASERRGFEAADVADAIARKLIRRHPHVFTAGGRPLSPRARKQLALSTPAQVKQRWERIKAKERASARPRTGATARLLSGVPKAMPAMQRAHEIGRRVAAVGFDWSTASDVVGKMEEELREVREALSADPARTAEEVGDFLFTAASFARKLGIEPESALRMANDKFTARFDALEAALDRRGRTVHEVTASDLEDVWNQVKHQEARMRRVRQVRQVPQGSQVRRVRRAKGTR